MGIVKKIIFGLLILFFLSSLTKNFFEYRRNLQFYKQYKDDYEKEKARNNELKSELVKNTDTFQMEKTIRNRLNLLKKDEIAVMLPEPSPTPTVLTPTPQPVHDQWKEVFFH